MPFRIFNYTIRKSVTNKTHKTNNEEYENISGVVNFPHPHVPNNFVKLLSTLFVTLIYKKYKIQITIYYNNNSTLEQD